MPAERIAMHKIRELLRLKYDCALSHERIARALSISKGVVAKYVKAAEECGRPWAELSAADEAQLRGWLGGTMRPRGATAGYVPPDLAAVHQGLKRKNVTLALLWEEYAQTAGGPSYQYSRFCDLYRAFARTLKRSMRQVHRAGEKLFIDYAGDTVPIVDADTGEISRAQIFVAVLGASSYTFACATATQSQADWLGSLAKALSFIGGVPELVVPDNTRSLVGQADRYEPQLQRTTAEFAAHYGVAILPARPYKPQDKDCAAYCTSCVEWVVVWRGCCGSSSRLALMLELRRGARAGRFEQALALIIVAVRCQQSSASPDLDCGGCDVEALADLGQRKHAACT